MPICTLLSPKEPFSKIYRKKTVMLSGFDEARTLQTKTIIGDKGERARFKDDITRSSVWSLFHCDLFRSLQVLISQAQAYNLRLLNSIKLRVVTSNVM